MTKVAYLDCPTGISGDMCLGALVDAGVPLAYLSEQLGRLGIEDEYRLRAELIDRNGQQATKMQVEILPTASGLVPPASPAISPAHNPIHPHDHPNHTDHQVEQVHPGLNLTVTALTSRETPHSHVSHPHHSRHLPEIEQLILAADLPECVTQWSLAIFRRLAEAEGAVHGISPEQVHFHEVGATDAIVDIVGTCLGLNWLGIEQLYCSALPVGGGTVWAAHGRLPVPPPAVLKLWEMRQVPLYSNGINQELVTPTGAAIATTLAVQFGAPPAMLLQKVGLGAGTKEFAIPNILRLWIGEMEIGNGRGGRGDSPLKTLSQQELGIRETSGNVLISNTSTTSNASNAEANDIQHPVTEHLPFSQETVAVLETQIDDLNPQAIAYVMTELLSAGALDVFTQAIGMKKSRLGVLLTVICRPEQVTACEAIIFQETTTLGIRHASQRRSVLERVIEAVEIVYGLVRVKVARYPDGTVVNVQPEYEDCAQLARQHHLPWREIHRLAVQAWQLAN